MTADTFTRNGSRIVIRPGPGAWTREFAWYAEPLPFVLVGSPSGLSVTTASRPREPDGYPMTTDVPGGDGLAVRYTVHVAGLPAVDGIRMYRVVLEATEAGAEHHGPHAVIVLSDVVMTAWRFDEPGEVRESAEGSIRQAHHWVALALRMAAPMDRKQAEWLAACHLCGMDDSSEIVAALQCPPLGLVPT